MPRIDPERLLKCLAPLLDPNSGAIRSTEEVDKILGLMSKFSKKLVSKCIYINILRATDSAVVDLFMERGGWNLVFGWTNDAISNKNYSLLQEIFELLLRTPVTIPRLKSNRFPIVVKNFSKVCEDETTKNLCKQLVHRWITVAKAEEKTEHAPAPPGIPLPPQQELISGQQHSISAVGPIPGGTGGGVIVDGGELPNLGNMNADHLLNIDPASLPMIPDADVNHQNLMDLDLTNSELAAIDFNLDIYNFGGDTHSLDDAITGGVATQAQIQQPPPIMGGEMISALPSSVAAPISVIQHTPAPLQQLQQPQLMQQQIPQQQHHQIILEQHVQSPQQTLQSHHHSVLQPQQQIHPQQIIIPAGSIATTSNVIITNANTLTHTMAPHIMQQQPPIQILHQQQAPPPQQAPPTMIIKEDPQQQQQMISLMQMQAPPKLVIKSMGGQRAVVQNLPTDSGQYCLMVKDGKNYLVRLKEQSNVVMANPANPVTSVMVQPPPQLPPQQQLLPPPPPVVISAPSNSVVVPDPGINRVPPLIIKRECHDTPDGGSVPGVKKVKNPKLVEPQIVSPVNKVPGDMKTYSKTKSSSSSSGTSKDKKSSSDKDHHHKSSSSSKSKSSSDGHSSSSSSSHHRKSKKESAASKAAAAAAQAKEEERLREKIRREKAQMKKRQKEQDKQKQQTEKDQETLKKLNLIPTSTSTSSGSSASSSPGSLKIPKIPKRFNCSFTDAIGIPGSDGVSGLDKIKKVSSDKSKESKESSKETKEKRNEDSDGSGSNSPVKKFYGKNEEEAAADEKPKERRHKVKVFVSNKSRSDELLKEMTESGSGKKTNKDKDSKDKEDKEAVNKSSGVTLGNSIPATPPKISKRLSTESLEKPGDSKKPKLDTKDKPKEQSVKDKIRKTVAASLKESSLFMDAISAGAESTKSVKKKRRTSSGGEGSKDAPKVGDLTPGDGLPTSSGTEEPSTPVIDPEKEEPVKKPVFNFYRDTLNDEDDADEGNTAAESKKEMELSPPEKKEEDAGEETAAFTPQEGDGKVKSALVLVRARNRPRKTVRWREEDELREFHFFEMDETERVNVTKQKDFTELTNNEQAIEGSYLKRRGEEVEQEKNQPWRMRKIWFTTDVLNPPVISTEVVAQEEREKNVLGLFLPPGSVLPDSAVEADLASNLGERPEPKTIPVEDVISITKVCDYRTHQWPDPVGGPPTFGGISGGMMMGRGGGGYGGGVPPQQHHPHHHHNPRAVMEGHNHPQFPPQNHIVNQRQFPPQMVPHPTSSPTQLQPVPQQQQDYNPWSANLGFSVPPPVVPVPPVTADLGAFAQFGAPPTAVTMLGQGVPPPLPFQNPFAFPPPANPMMNGQLPGAGVGMVDYGAGNIGPGNRGNEGGNHHRGGGSRFEGNDRRNNFGSGGRENRADRDRSNSRDRDYRDDRGGRDRDYRRSTTDRDYRNNHERGNSNDRNNRDHRRDAGGRNIRKEIPCRFFKKGFCGNGSRCEFLHEGPAQNDRGSRRSPSDQTDNNNPQQSPTFNFNSKDDDDWEDAASNSIPDSAQSPPQEEQTVNPNHTPRMTSRFSDAPMSPTEESPSSPVGTFGGPGSGGTATGGTSETTKVIPV